MFFISGGSNKHYSRPICRTLGKLGILFLALVVVLATASLSFAADPINQIVISPSLSLTNGQQYYFRFELWDSSSKGTRLWVEVKRRTVSGGKITHPLGSVTALSPEIFEVQTYLALSYRRGTTGGWTSLGSRTRFYPVPYAMFAKRVDLGAIDSLAIEDGSILSQDIASGAITEDKLSGRISTQMLDQNISDHLQNYDNPHQVTYSQVGAAPLNHSHYTNTIVVSPAGTEVANGTALKAALAAISTNSSTNRYLLKIEPGVFDLGTDTTAGSGYLRMKPYVDIEGSGIGVTIIKSSGHTDGIYGTVICENNSSLRQLTIENHGSNQYAQAYYCNAKTTGVNISNVKVYANSSDDGYGLYLVNTAVTMDNSTVAVTSGRSATGVFSYYSVFDAVSSKISATSTSASVGVSEDSYGINYLSDAEMGALKAITVTASGGRSSYGVYMSDGGTPKFNGINIVSGGANVSSYGLFISSANAEFELFTASAQNAPTNKAIFSNFGFSNGNVVKLRHFTAKATGGTGGSNSAVDAIGTFLTLDHGTVEAIGNASSYGLSLDTHDPAEIVNSNITADDATGDNIGLYTSNGGTAIVKITNSQMRGQSGQDARGAYLRGCGLNAQSSVFIGINGTTSSKGIVGSSSSGTPAIFAANSQIEGIDSTIDLTGTYSAKAVTTKLSGGATSGPVSCLYSFDENGTSSGATICP